MSIDRRNLLIGSVCAFGVAMVAGCNAFASYVRSKVFRPDPMPVQALAIEGVHFEPLDLSADGGKSLRGLVGKPSRPPKAVVVYLHGNGGNAEKGAREAAILVDAGYHVVAADYRGYGGNPGEPSEAGFVADASRFLDHATRVAAGAPLLVVGHSMGGAVAVLLLGTAAASGLMTIGTFSSLSDVSPPIARPFLPDRFDVVAAAKRVRIPWLIAHGTDDELVPPDLARRLSEAATGGRADLLLLPHETHWIEPETLLRLTDTLLARAR